MRIVGQEKNGRELRVFSESFLSVLHLDNENENDNESGCDEEACRRAN